MCGGHICPGLHVWHPLANLWLNFRSTTRNWPTSNPPRITNRSQPPLRMELRLQVQHWWAAMVIVRLSDNYSWVKRRRHQASRHTLLQELCSDIPKRNRQSKRGVSIQSTQWQSTPMGSGPGYLVSTRRPTVWETAPIAKMNDSSRRGRPLQTRNMDIPTHVFLATRRQRRRTNEAIQ